MSIPKFYHHNLPTHNDITNQSTTDYLSVANTTSDDIVNPFQNNTSSIFATIFLLFKQPVSLIIAWTVGVIITLFIIVSICYLLVCRPENPPPTQGNARTSADPSAVGTEDTSTKRKENKPKSTGSRSDRGDDERQRLLKNSTSDNQQSDPSTNIDEAKTLTKKEGEQDLEEKAESKFEGQSGAASCSMSPKESPKNRQTSMIDETKRKPQDSDIIAAMGKGLYRDYVLQKKYKRKITMQELLVKDGQKQALRQAQAKENELKLIQKEKETQGIAETTEREIADPNEIREKDESSTEPDQAKTINEKPLSGKDYPKAGEIREEECTSGKECTSADQKKVDEPVDEEKSDNQGDNLKKTRNTDGTDKNNVKQISEDSQDGSKPITETDDKEKKKENEEDSTVSSLKVTQV